MNTSIRAIFEQNCNGIVLNALAVFLYLLLSAWSTWEAPGTPCPYEQAGAPIVWGMTALPVFLICFIINAIWLVSILAGLLRRQFSYAPVVWLLAVLAWFATYRIDSFMRFLGSVETPDCRSFQHYPRLPSNATPA
jgi:hypothetical protein